MQNSNIITVTAAVIIKNACVLLARRNHDKTLGGMWEFPGGKQENNESLKECLERELLEELGVKSNVGDVLMECIHQYDFATIHIVGMITETYSDDFKLNDHDVIEWVRIVDLLNYKLAPADIPLAKKLIEENLINFAH